MIKMQSYKSNLGCIKNGLDKLDQILFSADILLNNI